MAGLNTVPPLAAYIQLAECARLTRDVRSLTPLLRRMDALWSMLTPVEQDAARRVEALLRVARWCRWHPDRVGDRWVTIYATVKDPIGAPDEVVPACEACAAVGYPDCVPSGAA